jgi:hypothetical protein
MCDATAPPIDCAGRISAIDGMGHFPRHKLQPWTKIYLALIFTQCIGAVVGLVMSDVADIAVESMVGYAGAVNREAAVHRTTLSKPALEQLIPSMQVLQYHALPLAAEPSPWPGGLRARKQGECRARADL